MTSPDLPTAAPMATRARRNGFSSRGASPAPADRSAAVTLSARLGVYLIAIYVVTKMIYLFNEGTAQPADILLGALALLIASPRSMLRFLSDHISLLALLVWIAVVNLTWFAITAKLDMTYFILFYIFNAVIVMTVYTLRLRAPALFDRYMILALQASIVIQFVLVLMDSHTRAQGSFQNPNQLAYWAIAALSIYFVIRRNITRWIDLPFILLANYCVFASLSRAGFISCLMMLLVWAWLALRTTFQRLAGGLFAALLLIGAWQGGLVSEYIERSDTAQKFENRLETKTDTDLGEGRNYNRIAEFYEYTIFGAGEGYYSRFEPAYVVAIEIHSSFATMLFSYGIIGLGLFLAFLYSVVRPLPLSLSFYLIPSLIYGITHQGLRFTFFWVLIGTMMAIGAELSPGCGKAAASASRKLPSLKPWRPRGPEELRQQAANLPTLR